MLERDSNNDRCAHNRGRKRAPVKALAKLGYRQVDQFMALL